MPTISVFVSLRRLNSKVGDDSLLSPLEGISGFTLALPDYFIDSAEGEVSLLKNGMGEIKNGNNTGFLPNVSPSFHPHSLFRIF